MDKIYYCYKATNTENGKIYIGFATDPKKRWRQHKADAIKGRGYVFHDAIRKHGWDKFEFEVICCGRDKQEMLEYVEPALIEQFHSNINQNGYNMHRKVMGVSSRPIDIRRKRTLEEMKNAHVAACSPEAREKRSQTMKMQAATPLGREHIFRMARNGHTSDACKKQSETKKRLAAQKPYRMATCHPTIKHYGKGLCEVCYNKTRRKPTIKENNYGFREVGIT